MATLAAIAGRGSMVLGIAPFFKPWITSATAREILQVRDEEPGDSFLASPGLRLLRRSVRRFVTKCLGAKPCGGSCVLIFRRQTLRF